MAAGNTNDIRTHVLGDMLMVTGTFTDGGIDYYYGDQLSTVLAAGGFATSVYDTGVTINNGAGYAIGETGALAVDGVDARLHFNVGEAIYNAAGIRAGVITAIGSATAITVGGGLIAPFSDDDTLSKHGVMNPAITLTNDTLDVSVDTIAEYVVFGTGNLGATSTAATLDGRWWILGQR